MKIGQKGKSPGEHVFHRLPNWLDFDDIWASLDFTISAWYVLLIGVLESTNNTLTDFFQVNFK